MTMETNNTWRNDEELKSISPEKLEFIDRIFIQSTKINPHNQKEMMSYLLSLNKLSRDNNISFNKKEMEIIFNVLKKYSTPSDIAKMEKISSFFHFQ
jgi:hypothetical protein